MIRKRLLLLIAGVSLSLGLGVAFTAAAAPGEKAAEFTMTVGTVAPADSPWAALLQSFKDGVEKRTGGRVKVKLMLGGVIGDENEMVTKASRGQLQAYAGSTGALATKIPELNLVELPFLFRTNEEADRVLDHVLTEPYEKLFKERGLVFGFWNENGYRHFGTRDKPIRKPEDLKGRKMRVQENPVHIMMYKAFGAAAVPLPTTEVTQALATGNVDGFDQALLYAIAAGWHKFTKHFTLSAHILQPAAIVYNKPWFEKLPADVQKIVLEEGRAVQPKGRKAVRAILPELKEILTYEKIQVYELSAEERAAFERAAQPVYAEFRKTFGPKASELLDKAQAELKKIRGQ